MEKITAIATLKCLFFKKIHKVSTNIKLIIAYFTIIFILKFVLKFLCFSRERSLVHSAMFYIKGLNVC